jgi:hypothetical protein
MWCWSISIPCPYLWNIIKERLLSTASILVISLFIFLSLFLQSSGCFSLAFYLCVFLSLSHHFSPVRLQEGRIWPLVSTVPGIGLRKLKKKSFFEFVIFLVILLNFGRNFSLPRSINKNISLLETSWATPLIKMPPFY